MKTGLLLIRHVANKIFFTLLFHILLGSVLTEVLWEQSITIWYYAFWVPFSLAFGYFAHSIGY